MGGTPVEIAKGKYILVGGANAEGGLKDNPFGGKKKSGQKDSGKIIVFNANGGHLETMNKPAGQVKCIGGGAIIQSLCGVSGHQNSFAFLVMMGAGMPEKPRIYTMKSAVLHVKEAWGTWKAVISWCRRTAR